MRYLVSNIRGFKILGDKKYRLIRTIMLASTVGMLSYILGYAHSYQDNITRVVESHRIPQECVATHNYCITVKEELRLCKEQK